MENENPMNKGESIFSLTEIAAVSSQDLKWGIGGQRRRNRLVPTAGRFRCPNRAGEDPSPDSPSLWKPCRFGRFRPFILTPGWPPMAGSLVDLLTGFSP
jgi:hypothetical protein